MAEGAWGTDIDRDWPAGEHDALTCRWCGTHRALDGQDPAVGRRVLVCWICDTPAPAIFADDVLPRTWDGSD